MEDDILSRDILFNNASDHIHYMGAHVSKEYAVKTFDFSDVPKRNNKI
jgi:hypothetical protein